QLASKPAWYAVTVLRWSLTRRLLAAACVRKAGPDVGKVLRLGTAEHGPRFVEARQRDAQIEIVRRRALDQCIQHRIAELLPPRGLELRGALACGVQLLHVRRGQRRLVVVGSDGDA